MFPHEAVPDGAALAPHHAWVGLLVAVLAAAVVWDNHPREEPWGLLASHILLGFSFGMVWPYYSRLGALGSLLGVTLATISLTLHPALVYGLRHVGLGTPLGGAYWLSHGSRSWWAVCLLGTLISADDVLEHALGWSTPLDWFWKAFLHGWLMDLMNATF